jgi:hypothetical protein
MLMRLFCTALLLIMFTACNAEVSNQLVNIERLKNDFEQHVAGYYDEYKISEIKSKSDNKKVFLEKVMGKQLLVGAKSLSYKEIQIQELSKKEVSHLGIAELIYISDEVAKKAYLKSEAKGYFSNTKILTKYVMVNDQNINVIFYSETSLDKVIKTFLEKH